MQTVLLRFGAWPGRLSRQAAARPDRTPHLVASDGESCGARSWTASVKSPQHSLPGSHTAPGGNSAQPSPQNSARPRSRYHSAQDLPHPKPASVRALASVLRIEFRFIPSISAVFRLPDELILSIFSHITPDPRHTGHHARFRVQYGMVTNNYHQQRMETLLRPLSNTCRAMRLRLLPWVWERLECLAWKLDATANFIHANGSLAVNMKYFCPLLCTWVEADWCPLEVHDGVCRVGRAFVRLVPNVPPKPPHARDRTGEQVHAAPAQERA
jgi:hypothetical protein